MTAQRAVAITGGRLFDGTGAPPLEPANVVIEDGRISAVGPAASVPVPEGATVIDTAGKTVMPGLIVPSTDTPFANMMPGFSLHLELAELVEAGIPNSDVLQAATRVAAQTLRRGDDLGTLEAGKIADVLVVDGDPLVDINATRSVVTVIKDGVPYDPQELLDRVTT